MGLLVLKFVSSLRGLEVGLEAGRLRITGGRRRGHGQRIRFLDHSNGGVTIIPPLARRSRNQESGSGFEILTNKGIRLQLLARSCVLPLRSLSQPEELG